MKSERQLRSMATTLYVRFVSKGMEIDMEYIMNFLKKKYKYRVFDK